MLRNEIVEVRKNECFTTSKIIADKLEVKHMDFLRTIDRLLEKSKVQTSTLKLSQKFIETTFENKQKAKYR